MKAKYEINAKVLKALSDPNRLEIIDLLSCGEKCACEILESFKFTQPTLSHHMKVLMDCGLVEFRKEGTWYLYKLNIENANKLVTFLRDMVMEAEDYKCNDYKSNEEKYKYCKENHEIKL